jgi:uncharacterized protein
MANAITPKCPICKDARAAAYAPFCSKRCADIDLGRWLKGTYAIAGRDEDDGADKAEMPKAIDEDDAP